MKKVKYLFICLISFLIISCSHSYEEVIENFNKKYFREEPMDNREYSITSSGFNTNQMLLDSYTFKNGMGFSLVAPDGGSDYYWGAIVLDADTKTEKEISIGTDKSLSYLLPGVFRTDVVNKLVLVVTDSNGNEYKDTAFIIIE